jgi:hypothetical protein
MVTMLKFDFTKFFHLDSKSLNLPLGVYLVSDTCSFCLLLVLLVDCDVAPMYTVSVS